MTNIRPTIAACMWFLASSTLVLSPLVNIHLMPPQIRKIIARMKPIAKRKLTINWNKFCIGIEPILEGSSTIRLIGVGVGDWAKERTDVDKYVKKAMIIPRSLFISLIIFSFFLFVKRQTSKGLPRRPRQSRSSSRIRIELKRREVKLDGVKGQL